MAGMRRMRPSILGTEHVDISLGRVAVRKPGAHEPNMPNVSKFRATKPRIEDADAHVCLALNSRYFDWAVRCPHHADTIENYAAMNCRHRVIRRGGEREAATASGRAVPRFRLRSLSYGEQVAPRKKQ
jgi:hypothetical protein